MKKFLIISLIILYIAQLQAQMRIGQAEAYLTAEQFVSQQRKHEKQTLTLSEEIKSKQSGQTNLFVFSMQPQGFIIVSALNEVLAYSLNSPLPISAELPDHITYWLDLYNQQTDYLIAHPEQHREPTKSQNAVGPLLTTIWGQGCYHNASCPEEPSGPCQHVSAGCVAIAIAQIMYYHKQPMKGTGSMSYHCSPYGTLSANFENTTYRWEEMADTLHGPNSAVAELVFHCGVSVKTVYSAHQSSSSGANALNAFHHFFSYPWASYLQRYNSSDEEWLAMIKKNMDEGHPVYYQGKSYLGHHAFVCDGYDSNGLFHFNFGWDGVADGYYTLDDPSGFSESQCAILDIFPIIDIPINSDEHGIIYVSPDGTGDGSSWEQATNELQMAIFKSQVDNLSVWVKEGVYYSSLSDYYAFRIMSSCKLYGGFKGDEPFNYDLSLRDFEAHPSVLDGNHRQGVINVLTLSDYEEVVIDGFTIQNGTSGHGGGLRLTNKVSVKNCKICHNYSNSNGGGLAQSSNQNQGTITVEDCEFFDNEAKFYGGAIYDNGNVSLLRCQIHDNIARKSGGGIYCSSHKPNHFIQCTFSNNFASEHGGGINCFGEGNTFWSCVISNNTAGMGGGCYLAANNQLYNCTIVKNEATDDYGGVYNSDNDIRNCIIWGNLSSGENTQIGPSETYSYCAVEGLSDTERNFNADTDNDGSLPRFYVRFKNANVAAGSTGHGGDWRLQSDSPCIDRVMGITGQPATDLEGNPRLRHRKVDLGAFESDATAKYINAYYCEDEPYYYQDSLISELGIYTFFEHTVPYDSLYVVVMQIPPPTVFLNEVICENGTYDFFGTLLTEPGQYTTTDRCVTYRLKLAMEPLDTIPMEKDICEDETYYFFGLPLKEAGHYSTTVDCKTYELDLTVNPVSYVPVPMEEEICEGETYYFFDTPLTSGGYYSSTINCKGYELYLTVLPRPLLQCSNDTLVEYGNFIHLTASGADSYLWSTGDTTESITVYPMVDKRYTVTGFSKNGCSTEASVLVRVFNEGDEMVVYPNPASSKVEIYMPLIDEVEVLNLLGTRVDHVNANREVVELDVSHYDSGVYIVHVKCLSNHHYKKLIIQH